MMEELHERNANLMISVWPNMSHESDNYKEFKDKGLLLPASDIYNPFVEEGRKTYWKQLNEGLFSHGVDAWWCDSSEPFTPEWNHQGKPEPSTMYHEFYDTSSNTYQHSFPIHLVYIMQSQFMKDKGMKVKIKGSKPYS